MLLKILSLVLVCLCCCSCNTCDCGKCDYMGIDITKAEILADGLCHVELDVSNTSDNCLYLLNTQGAYPELHVSVYDMSTGEEKRLSSITTNHPIDFDSYELHEVQPKSSRQLSLAFDVADYDVSERLVFSVGVDLLSKHRVLKEIEKVSSDCLSKSKGSRVYPSMSDTEIKKVKATLLLQRKTEGQVLIQ